MQTPIIRPADSFPNARRAPRWSRWPVVAVAVCLSACMQSPQAAVPPASASSGTMPHGLVTEARCAQAPSAGAALSGAIKELQAHGMALQARCVVGDAGAAGWVVQVRVVDGLKASKVVRGPLADGHEVDMGTPAGVRHAGARTGASGFSPDVQHNRQWLAAVMQRHQFDNLPDAWWLFAQRGSSQGPTADTDLAVK